MFTIYYDASGHEEDPSAGVLVITGFLATVNTWLTFERVWAEFLSRYGVPYLHMREYTQFAQPYDRWRSKRRKRGSFLGRAAQIIKAAQFRSFSAGFLLREYHSIYPLYERLPGPYQLAAGAVLMSVVHWLTTHQPGEPYQHVFARGDTGQGPFRKQIEENAYTNLGPITTRQWRDPTTGEYFHPFEPADYYAWEHRNLFNEYLGGKGARTRKSLEALEGMPEHGLFMRRDRLIELCDLLNQPRRR